MSRRSSSLPPRLSSSPDKPNLIQIHASLKAIRNATDNVLNMLDIYIEPKPVPQADPPKKRIVNFGNTKYNTLCHGDVIVVTKKVIRKTNINKYNTATVHAPHGVFEYFVRSDDSNIYRYHNIATLRKDLIGSTKARSYVLHNDSLIEMHKLLDA